ncbi:MAG: CorA family divalent cation transporter, partial [Thermovirgaceae bacterium]|nr:CorA family divalent cation transporter [Thermovirgaceae bacterium]
SLERSESFQSGGTAIYMRDLYDHIIQVIDGVETIRDLLAGMLDIYLSSVSNRMNEIMKVLTMIATIFIPLTFLAGVYGMNFKNMPEIGWKWSYPVLWCIMIGLAGFMLAFFRRKKWL